MPLHREMLPSWGQSCNSEDQVQSELGSCAVYLYTHRSNTDVVKALQGIRPAGGSPFWTVSHAATAMPTSMQGESMTVGLLKHSDKQVQICRQVSK